MTFKNAVQTNGDGGSIFCPMVIKYSIITHHIMTKMLIYFVLPLVLSFSCNRQSNFEKNVMFPDGHTDTGTDRRFFLNCRMRLNKSIKGKTKYMIILFIIWRVSILYLRIIGQKIKPPSPFIWKVFLNVTIVTWLYISPIKRPREMKFYVKLD